MIETNYEYGKYSITEEGCTAESAVYYSFFPFNKNAAAAHIR